MSEPATISGPITGLVLAGGQSRRMGRDKAEIMVDGRTLLDHAKDALHAAGCETVLVAGAGGIPDRYPGHGPLAGIDAALGMVRDGGLLVLPVDMPLMQVETLKILMKQQFAAHFEGESLPCLIPANAKVRAYIERILAEVDADRSLMALYRHLHARTIAIANPREFHNCNRPEDLENLS